MAAEHQIAQGGEKKAWLSESVVRDLLIACAFSLVLMAGFLATDFGDEVIKFIERHEHWELDEILLLFLVGAVGAFVFGIRRMHELGLEVRRRTAAEHEVAQLALYDSLTGLANRRLFEDRLHAALARAKREKEMVAVIMFDLDRFKPVNDLHGHQAGDLLLRMVAQRVEGVVRQEDTFARFGGDEFAIVQVAFDLPTRALRLARRLITAMEAPFLLSGTSVTIGLSAGIAVYPDDGDDAAHLIRRADVALYRAKSGGRGRFCFFEAHMDDHLQERATLERDLRQAIATGAIEPFYQPIVDLRSGRILGFEALARWNHPTRGLLVPDVFIPVAEDSGLISALGETILRRACRDALGWQREAMLSINVSPLQFRNRRLAEDILQVLAEEGLPPHRLEIEMTENALFDDPEQASDIIGKLKDTGVQIALDDFGTGYSSLAHLRDLPFDKIKIDRSFVLKLDKGEDGPAIVKAIISMCQSLGLPTIAEGVELETHRSALIDEGCAFGQGFLFSAPISSQDIARLLNTDCRAATRHRD